MYSLYSSFFMPILTLAGDDIPDGDSISANGGTSGGINAAKGRWIAAPSLQKNFNRFNVVLSKFK